MKPTPAITGQLSYQLHGQVMRHKAPERRFERRSVLLEEIPSVSEKTSWFCSH
jgi:hypothetical protein